MRLIKSAKKIAKKILRKDPPQPAEDEKIKNFLSGDRIPWSDGYHEYKWDFINRTILDESILDVFAERKPLPKNYGLKLDDRSVEYPWIFASLRKGKSRLLDAGSTFNFPGIVNHPIIEEKETTIVTYFPENYTFNEKRISYVYADLREVPLRDKWFDEVVCQSTLEHIDMDNSMYGYENASQDLGKQKNFGYKSVLSELIRVLKPGGQLLLTFPYGKYEFHGFFQQFDTEMVNEMMTFFQNYGSPQADFFIYREDGWHWSDIVEASQCESFNPHTGIGKGSDGAAHSRAICCIKLTRNK